MRCEVGVDECAFSVPFRDFFLIFDDFSFDLFIRWVFSGDLAFFSWCIFTIFVSFLFAWCSWTLATQLVEFHFLFVLAFIFILGITPVFPQTSFLPCFFAVCAGVGGVVCAVVVVGHVCEETDCGRSPHLIS